MSDPLPRRRALLPLAVALALVGVATAGCKKGGGDEAKTATGAATAAPKTDKPLKVGLVTDVGGRGDQSFNDSALRGLELWSAGKVFTPAGYQPAPAGALAASLSADLAARKISPLTGITPVVLQSKVQEDYEPNIQLLVDQGMDLTIATGFMLENGVEAVATRNPTSKLLLIDSPLLDTKGTPFSLPNVRSVVFREEQGSFLVGALAGLVAKTGKIGFVGGMEIPLIKKFEAGFRAGVLSTNPKAAAELVVAYTGSFDNVAAGKQVGQDMASKVEVLFHAAGTDGLGIIQAVKEARAAGKQVWVIGVDSDQAHLAPEAVLTSMVKRVDLAVFDTVRDLAAGKFEPGLHALGLAEGGVAYAEVRVELPQKAELIQKVEALRQKVVAGEIKVPSNMADFANFKAPSP